MRTADFDHPRVRLAWTALIGVMLAFAAMMIEIVYLGRGVNHLNDFHPIWVSAKLIFAGDWAVNYDAEALHLRHVEAGVDPHWRAPFPYPPFFMPFLGPLGALPQAVAWAGMLAVTFAFYLWAVLGSRPAKSLAALSPLLAPTAAVNAMFGQTGFLSGALMVGGLRLATSRPYLAGALFGALAYKPQLGLFIPLALAAAGLWRAIGAAALTVLFGIVASSAIYGPGAWLTWLHSVTAYSQDFEPIYSIMPTLAANLHMLGAGAGVSLGVEIAAALVVGWTIWNAFRAGVTPRASALLTIGTFLVTPHALVYDLPMMSGALLWWFHERMEADKRIPTAELLVLVSCFAFAPIMAWHAFDATPMSWAPEMLAFALVAGGRTSAKSTQAFATQAA